MACYKGSWGRVAGYILGGVRDRVTHSYLPRENPQSRQRGIAWEERARQFCTVCF